MKTIKVNCGKKSYPVLIGNSIFSSLFNQIEKLNLYKNIFAVVDDNVYKYHSKAIKVILRKFNKSKIHKLNPGEKSKSNKELNKIYSSLLEDNFSRDTLLISIGGGVTGDLSGFAASTYMRGIQLIHVPTTLLAMVDSAIGGKTGINLNEKKNIVGTFYQPQFVLIDTNFLETLPEPEFISGLGEIVKYGFIADKDLFKFVKDNWQSIYKNDHNIISEIISKSVAVKSAVVSQDEKETGLRKILNFGHTFAHAFESEINFKVKHGEAVIAGIISAIFLSDNLGFIKKAKMKEYLDFLQEIKIPDKFFMMDKENVYNFMKADKKSRENNIKFVLISDIGNTLLDVEVSKKNVLNSIDKMVKFISM